MLTVESAQRLIFKNIRTLAPRTVFLKEALGTVLAEKVVSGEALPSWDNAAVDGVALRSRDGREASSAHPVMLKCTGSVFAGDFPKRVVRSGTALKIFTGAPLPRGADAVVMQEELVQCPISPTPRKWLRRLDNVQDGEWIKICRPVQRGENVRKRGEEIKKNQVVLKPGRSITPSVLGLCAALGKSKVRVFPKPKIALFSTGNELTEIQGKLKPGKIRDANTFILQGLIQQMGLDAKVLGIAQDHPEQIRKKIQTAFQSADLVLASGGVSVGEADYIQQVLRKLGAKIVFWKVNCKPGKPLLFALLNGKPFFGLPGNPVSAFVTFHIFVKPALAKLSRLQRTSPEAGLAHAKLTGKNFFKIETVPARLYTPLRERFSRRTFLRGIFFYDGSGERWVKILSRQGSHQLFALSQANCLVDISEGKIRYARGVKVCILPLAEW